MSTTSHRTTARTAGLVAGAAIAVATGLLGAPAAQAAPACADPVASTLHAAHDRTGDPAGVFHTAEDTYCDARG